jgi:hypothetical protein
MGRSGILAGFTGEEGDSSCVFVASESLKELFSFVSLPSPSLD